MAIPPEYIFAIALFALLIGAIIIAIILNFSNTVTPVDYGGLSIIENEDYSTNSIYTWGNPIIPDNSPTTCSTFLFKTITQTTAPTGTQPPLCVSYQPQVATLNTELLDEAIANGTSGVNGSVILVENAICQDPDMISAIKVKQTCLCRSPTGGNTVCDEDNNTISWCITYDGQRFSPNGANNEYMYYSNDLCNPDTSPSIDLKPVSFCNGSTMLLAFNYYPLQPDPDNPNLQGICINSCKGTSNGRYAWNCEYGNTFDNPLCPKGNCEDQKIYGNNLRCLVAIKNDDGTLLAKNSTCDFTDDDIDRKIMRITATYPNLETGIPIIPPDTVKQPSNSNTVNGINFRIVERISGLCLNGDTGADGARIPSINFTNCNNVPTDGYSWLMLPPGTILDPGSPTDPSDKDFAATTWPQQLMWIGNNPIPTSSANYASFIDNLTAMPAYTLLPSSAGETEMTLLKGPLGYKVCGKDASLCINTFLGLDIGGKHGKQDFMHAMHAASQAIDPLLYHVMLVSDANFLAQFPPAGGTATPIYGLEYNYDSPFITGEFGF